MAGLGLRPAAMSALFSVRVLGLALWVHTHVRARFYCCLGWGAERRRMPAIPSPRVLKMFMVFVADCWER